MGCFQRQEHPSKSLQKKPKTMNSSLLDFDGFWTIVNCEPFQNVRCVVRGWKCFPQILICRNTPKLTWLGVHRSVAKKIRSMDSLTGGGCEQLWGKCHDSATEEQMVLVGSVCCIWFWYILILFLKILDFPAPNFDSFSAGYFHGQHLWGTVKRVTFARCR